jgi:predicted DNA-binding protein
MYQMNLEKLTCPKVTTSFTVYNETLDRLKEHAERRGNHLNVLLRSAVNDLLEKLDDELKTVSTQNKEG